MSANAISALEQPFEKDSSLGHMPAGKWKFDDAVTSVFEDMLNRSIPQLSVMRKMVLDIGSEFVIKNTDIVDLGCSRGDAIAPLIDRFGTNNHFIGIDASEPMVGICQRRFESLINAGTVDIRCEDLRNAYPPARASVTMLVLTLQFTPIEHRLRILSEVFAHTVPGGAFILVEKLIASNTVCDQLWTKLYYGHKREMGYTQEEIDRKRLSLEGVLVPMTASWNEDLLKGAGFRYVENFWRHLNFGGWLAIKE